MNSYQDLLKPHETETTQVLKKTNKKKVIKFENYFFYKHSKIKSGAKRRKLTYSLSPEFLESIFPRDFNCPILNQKFNFDHRWSTPSLDRICNDIGYEKENVIWVSLKANQIKNTADADLILKIANYYSSLKNAGD